MENSETSLTSSQASNRYARLESLITNKSWPIQLHLLATKLKRSFPQVPMPYVEEAISSAIENLVTKVPIFENERAMHSWLFFSTRFYLLHELRRLRRSVPIGEDVLSSRDEYRAVDHKHDIELMLEVLSVSDKELLLEHCHAGYPIVELAKKQGVSAERLESRSARAKKKIIKKYGLY